MKYNTIPITNIKDERFIGQYSGVNLVFEPKQIRFLPSFVAKHIAEQLVVSLVNDFKSKGKVRITVNEAKSRFFKSILGNEIQTADEIKSLSVKEEIKNHEEDYKNFLEEQEKKRYEQKIELLKQDI